MFYVYLVLIALFAAAVEASFTIWLYHQFGLYFSLCLVIVSFLGGCLIEYINYSYARNNIVNHSNDFSFETFQTMARGLIFVFSLTLFLFPGIVTDVVGVLLVVPVVRAKAINLLAKYLSQTHQQCLERNISSETGIQK